MSESRATADEATQEKQNQEQSAEKVFTQADVDRIVSDRVARERAKFADYDDLKAKVGEKATVEDQLKAMETRAAEAEARALRADIANKHGISAEDRDLFLTGADETSLTAQAERLAARLAEQQQQQNGPHVQREGDNPRPGDDPMRAWARQVFATAQNQE